MQTAREECCALGKKCLINTAEGEDVDWVFCEGKCQKWYHHFCVKYVTQEEAYICARCTAALQRAQNAKLKGPAWNFVIGVATFSEFVNLALKKTSTSHGDANLLHACTMLKQKIEDSDVSNIMLEFELSLSGVTKQTEAVPVLDKLSHNLDFKEVCLTAIFCPMNREKLPYIVHLVAQCFIRHLCNCVKDYVQSQKDPLPSASTSEGVRRLAPSEDMALKHIAGAVLSKMVKLAKKKLPQTAVKSFLEVTQKCGPTHSNDKYTAEVNRGKLYFVSDNFYKLFIHLDELTHNSYSKATCKDRKSTTLKLIQQDNTYTELWHTLMGGIEQSDKLYDFMINQFLAIRGFALARKYQEHHKKEKRLKTKKKQRIPGHNQNFSRCRTTKILTGEGNKLTSAMKVGLDSYLGIKLYNAFRS